MLIIYLPIHAGDKEERMVRNNNEDVNEDCD